MVVKFEDVSGRMILLFNGFERALLLFFKAGPPSFGCQVRN